MISSLEPRGKAAASRNLAKMQHLAFLLQVGERSSLTYVKDNAMPPIASEPHAEVAALAREAERCRRLANSLTDSRTVETLRLMAEDYERQAGADLGPA
jgi:hypothetical protein